MILILLITLFNLAFANLEDAIKQELHKKFGDTVRLLKVRPLGQIKDIQDISLDVEYGRFKSIAYVISDEREVKVFLDLLWKVKVYRAKENIPRGSPIDISMFEEDYIWVRTVPSDLKISLEDFPNYVTATNILKGAYLRKVYLRPIPAVRYGEIVRCTYREKEIIIKFSCKALDTGNIGKVIRVKPEGLEKVLRATITARGEVEVSP